MIDIQSNFRDILNFSKEPVNPKTAVPQKPAARRRRKETHEER
jgi:hypothetical protein